MNQADVTKLVSKLRFSIQNRHRILSNPKGAEGRLEKMRKTVTALIKYERIELYHPRADESRGYAERVSSTAPITNFRSVRIFTFFYLFHSCCS